MARSVPCRLDQGINTSDRSPTRPATALVAGLGATCTGHIFSFELAHLCSDADVSARIYSDLGLAFEAFDRHSLESGEGLDLVLARSHVDPGVLVP